MLSTYKYPKYDYVRPPEQCGADPRRHPWWWWVPGPVGLAAAIDLAQRGVAGGAAGRRRHRVRGLARPVCYAKRALEVLDRLGVARPWWTRA
jgi:3-(3-hydroxy-phenyl)propionate hydroxylase